MRKGKHHMLTNQCKGSLFFGLVMKLCTNYYYTITDKTKPLEIIDNTVTTVCHHKIHTNVCIQP